MPKGLKNNIKDRKDMNGQATWTLGVFKCEHTKRLGGFA
jgi:hypothetical protein